MPLALTRIVDQRHRPSHLEPAYRPPALRPQSRLHHGGLGRRWPGRLLAGASDNLPALRLTTTGCSPPPDLTVPARTLRVLAGLQATDSMPDTADKPGKITHDLWPPTLVGRQEACRTATHGTDP